MRKLWQSLTRGLRKGGKWDHALCSHTLRKYTLGGSTTRELDILSPFIRMERLLHSHQRIIKREIKISLYFVERFQILSNHMISFNYFYALLEYNFYDIPGAQKTPDVLLFDSGDFRLPFLATKHYRAARNNEGIKIMNALMCQE